MEYWSCIIDELKKQMKYWEPKKKEEEGEDTDNDVCDDEAMDTTENEPPSKEFLEAMSMPNTYRDFQQKLHQDHWDVNYHSQQSTDNCQDDEEEMDIDADEDLLSDEAEYVKILMFNSLKRMYAKFMTYCEQLPILGFNSSSYDLNLVKAKLGKILKSGGDKSTFTVKKSNKYLCLSCDINSNCSISHSIWHLDAAMQNFSRHIKSISQKAIFPMNGSTVKRSWTVLTCHLIQPSTPIYKM